MQKVKLDDDEQLVFGPATSLNTKGKNSGVERITASRDQLRTVQVTNQRVIVETGSRAISVPNHTVHTVTISPHKQGSLLKGYTLHELRCNGGQVIKLGISGVAVSQLATLEETFPNAQIREKSGLAKLFDRLLGGA